MLVNSKRIDRRRFLQVGTGIIGSLAGGGLIASDAAAQVELSEHFSNTMQNCALECVARIVAIYHNGTGSQGTGVCAAFFGQSSAYLTAHHVIGDMNQVRELRVEVFTRESYPNPYRQYRNPRSFYWSEPHNDLGLLAVGSWAPRSAPLAAGNVQVGEYVLSVGCGIGSPPVCQVAQVSGFDGRGDIVTNRGGINGRSGGALINRHGQLIGILSRGGNDRTVYIHLDKLRSFVNRVR